MSQDCRSHLVSVHVLLVARVGCPGGDVLLQCEELVLSGYRVCQQGLLGVCIQSMYVEGAVLLCFHVSCSWFQAPFHEFMYGAEAPIGVHCCWGDARCV